MALLLKPANPTPSKTEKIVPEGHRKGNKSPAVLQGSAARLSISIPICNQSTTCNPRWQIRSRESTIKRVHRVTPGLIKYTQAQGHGRRRSGGTAHEGGGCDQSIGSTVSDAIVRSWLWLTATRSSPVGCFSALLKVVDN